MKLRIGIVCPYDYTRQGGVQEHIKAVAKELGKRGHYVRVLAPTPPGGPKKAKDVVFLGKSKNIKTPLSTSTEITITASSKEISDCLEKHKFDIMSFHEPWAPVLSKQILDRSNSINVGTFHAKLPENSMGKFLSTAWLPYAKKVAAKLDYITVVSSAASDYISRVSDKELHLIPNGIDLSYFDKSKVGKYKEFDDYIATILFIGRLEGRKGLNYLLQSYKLLQQDYNENRLILAGSGPKKEELEAYVEQHKLKNVYFLGYVSEEDKLKLLNTCDLFVSPALYGESFGIVLLEAMAFSKPIVAGNNPGYASVMIGPGEKALVDPKEIDEFSKLLELMLYDQDERSRFVEWSDEYVKQFDYEKISDKYEKAFLGLKNKHE